ncbi:MAG: glucosaminidase domain-containing protein [Alphaproteobacteria bacterium]|nr:glucosaminidase domain-containing protein [Alphaproteobacteria bacterium]
MFKTLLRRTLTLSLVLIGSGLYVAGASLATAETDPKPPETSSSMESENVPIKDVKELEEVLEKKDCKLEQISQKDVEVPRIFVSNFPKDMKNVKNRQTKKDVFAQVLLPIILHENEIILKERAYILELKKNSDQGKPLKHHESAWLDKICEKYKLKVMSFDELLLRVDTIPPSLALGQATIESGMGISYAALKKNSPFGMTVSQKVLAYKSLSESVFAYMRNLNSNNAYKTMRKTRAELRKANKDVDGNALIGDLIAYCETGKPYIQQVRSAIRSNNLTQYDGMNLAPEGKA